VTEENIEEEHSTRNARLMRMMEDMHIVENRGSGIKAMLQAMRDANLEPARFDDRRSSFRVVLHNHTLMNPESIQWLNPFSRLNLNDRQRLALVYMRQHDQINNGLYRRLNRVDEVVAGQELRGLMQAGLADQQGVSRWTYYTLKAPRGLPEHAAPATDEDRIIAYVTEHGSINNTECRNCSVSTTFELITCLKSSLIAENSSPQEFPNPGGTYWRSQAKHRLPRIYPERFWVNPG
jgi:ATP-dependent DNA helicase RecG